MAKLAILGHATRGKEVIEILEMLGGINTYKCKAVRETFFYFIVEGEIDYDLERYITDEYTIFTLEQFLEKFPYKIGDKVYYDNKVCDVIEMLWNSNLNTISYGVYDDRIKNLAIVKELKPYKEGTMEEKNEKSANHVFDTEIISFDIAQRDRYELDLQGKFNVVLREGKYYVERIKPKYPKTYEECCKIRQSDPKFYIDTHLYSVKLESLYKLLICRDAYWKIAGKQMGLGKSWEPDWLNAEQDKYVLFTHNNAICSNRYVLGHNILAFPTAEMRDAFYENFKELIEQCKKLL